MGEYSFLFPHYPQNTLLMSMKFLPGCVPAPTVADLPAGRWPCHGADLPPLHASPWHFLHRLWWLPRWAGSTNSIGRATRWGLPSKPAANLQKIASQQSLVLLRWDWSRVLISWGNLTSVIHILKLLMIEIWDKRMKLGKAKWEFKIRTVSQDQLVQITVLSSACKSW